LDEIRDAEGKLLFNVGDKIMVMVMGHYNERPKISYKKVLEQEKTLAFINAHKDDFESVVIEALVTKKNKGGYLLEADDVHFFLPRVHSPRSKRPIKSSVKRSKPKWSK
jgi:small subunit ribosomal protein S1